MSEAFVEITIKGDQKLLKGFILGFLGQRDCGRAFIEQTPPEKDSPIELIVHFFSEHHHLTPVITERDLYESLCQAIQRRKKDLEAEILSAREIIAASFSFAYKTYSRDIGEALCDLFFNLPPGLTLQEGGRHKEKIDPDAGLELFAPLHAYEATGSGVVAGDIRPLYQLFRKTGRFDVVTLGKLQLEYGKELPC